MTAKNRMFEINIIDEEMIIFEGKALHRTNVTPFGNRAIYFTERYVIKVDIDKSFLQCANEFESWEKVKKTKYRKYFAPIVQAGSDNDFEYVIQRRVYSAKKETRFNPNMPAEAPWYTEHDNTIEEIRDRFGFVDIHRRNWTLTTRGVKIFDYSF